MDNKEIQRKFLEYFKKGGLVLELGSGRGDFLSLCSENGIKATGVDTGSNDEICRKYGVVKKDIRKFIRKEKAGKYDGVYARHVVEHFSPADVEGLLGEAHRILKKGGKLILVFPNMRNIHIVMYEFWTDPTHIRPYTGGAIEKLAEGTGFRLISSGPDTQGWDNSAIKRFVRTVRQIITGIPNDPPDYFMVMEK
jgi:O-antigen chain-terminating methyltransferase